MINQEINRILNSNICDSITVTVLKNNQDLQQLQTVLHKKNSEVLDLQNILMQQLNCFEKIVKENECHQTIIKMTQKFLNNISHDISKLKNLITYEIKSQLFQQFQNGINKTINFMHQQRIQQNISAEILSFDSSINCHKQLNKYEQKIQILNSRIQSLQEQLNIEKFKTQQLTNVNNLLRKQQLSKIFKKKSIKNIQNNFNSLQNSRQTLTLDYQSPSENYDLVSPKKSKVKSLRNNKFPYCFHYQILKEIQFQGIKINRKKQGKGFIFYQNNYTYQGSFVAGLRQGYGILRQGNQKIYSGDWEKDLFHGKGRLSSFMNCEKFKNWKYFLGNFKEGCIDGSGTIIFKNNERFIAKFIEGNINNNFGIMHQNKENNIVYGNYNNGVFNPTFL